MNTVKKREPVSQAAGEFHDTEIGRLPTSWRAVRVDSVFDIQQGKQVSKSNRVGENQRPFLRTKNVFWNRLNLEDLDQMHFTGSDAARLELIPNDLLVCEGGSIGRTALWNGEVTHCFYQNHLHRLRVIGDKVDPQFGVFWFWHAFEFAKLYFGRGNITTIPNLSRSKLAELPMALPPLTEQKKIAHILSTVQRAIEEQERIIQTTTELKKALMHKLFTEGLRNEPQKQTEIGPVPKSWEVVKIGDLNLDIGDGNYSTKYPSQSAFRQEGVAFLRANNLKQGRIVWNDMRFISPELHFGLRKGHTKPNDTILVTRGNIGEVAFVTHEFVGANMNAQLVRLNGHDRVDGRFLFYCFEHPERQKQFLSLTTGTALKQLPIGKLKTVQLPIPPPDVQREIAFILRKVDEKVEQSQAARNSLQDLFRNLLHDLMTAKTRIHQITANFDSRK